jgi:predicted transcriptional regulator
MRSRLSVHVDPGLMAQLIELAEGWDQPMPLILEAAVASFLTRDDAGRREGAAARRRDQLAREIERLKRDLAISVEALARVNGLWLTITQHPRNGPEIRSQAKESEPFDMFVEALGRRPAKGRSLVNDVSTNNEAVLPE